MEPIEQIVKTLAEPVDTQIDRLRKRADQELELTKAANTPEGIEAHSLRCLDLEREAIELEDRKP